MCTGGQTKCQGTTLLTCTDGAIWTESACPAGECAKPGCKNGACTTEVLPDGSDCGIGQVCHAGSCICACPNGETVGVPGCAAPKNTVAKATSSGATAPPEQAVDKNADSFWNANADTGSLTLTFPIQLPLTGISLRISTLGADPNKEVVCTYVVYDLPSLGPPAKVASSTAAYANGASTVQMQFPKPTAVDKLRIDGDCSGAASGGATFSNVAILEVGFASTCGI